MALNREGSETDQRRLWSHLKVPFWNSSATTASSTSPFSSLSNRQQQQQSESRGLAAERPPSSTPSDHLSSSSSSSAIVAAMAKSLLPARRRLRLDPSNKLYFPYEPGKQVRSAIEIRNVSKSHAAFKFQTTAPKSCYMRPPGGVLAPGERIIATVFKFVEPPENDEKPVNQKSRVKFKIMSLRVNGDMDYVPEMFDEQKDQVCLEKILRVVFLDLEHPNQLLEKLRRQLAEADAALELRKRPPEDPGVGTVKEGLVIDEWKERREKYLARQQVEGVDSL